MSVIIQLRFGIGVHMHEYHDNPAGKRERDRASPATGETAAPNQIFSGFSTSRLNCHYGCGNCLSTVIDKLQVEPFAKRAGIMKP